MKISDYGIPKKVKVSGVTYKVIFPYEFEDEETYCGLHEYGPATIKLSKTNSDREIHPLKVRETLLHELIHAIDCIYCDHILDEHWVNILASGLFYVLRYNDLKLGSGKISKKLDICGWPYTVNYPYDFKDNAGPAASSKPLILQLCISGYNGGHHKISPESAEQYLMMLIVTSICDIYDMHISEIGNDKEFSSGEVVMVDILSRGIYQTIKDNKLNEVIRK